MHAFCGFDVLDADGDVIESFGAPRRTLLLRRLHRPSRT
ncbi:unnamed protein product [Phaeothamnion confervicola]